MNKAILKRRIVLTLVLTILALNFVTISVQNSHAWGNGPYSTDATPRDYGVNTGIAAGYVFERDIYSDIQCHYGAHDWIADSAVRLIIDNPNLRDEVKWLFSEEIFDVVIKEYGHETTYQYRPLPLKSFDIWGSDAGNRKWFMKSTYAQCGINKPQWMMARRYARFLHGTSVPDVPSIKRVSIGDTPIPREAIFARSSRWMRVTGEDGSHSTGFEFDSDENDWKYRNNAGDDPAILCYQAALDAIFYLNYENGKGEPEPKYEAAAYCLGGTTHYIADCAVAAHVAHTIVNENAEHWTHKSDKGWELFVRKELVFDQNYGISKAPPYYGGGNGGPK